MIANTSNTNVSVKAIQNAARVYALQAAVCNPQVQTCTVFLFGIRCNTIYRIDTTIFEVYDRETLEMALDNLRDITSKYGEENYDWAADFSKFLVPKTVQEVTAEGPDDYYEREQEDYEAYDDYCREDGKIVYEKTSARADPTAFSENVIMSGQSSIYQRTVSEAVLPIAAKVGKPKVSTGLIASSQLLNRSGAIIKAYKESGGKCMVMRYIHICVDMFRVWICSERAPEPGLTSMQCSLPARVGSLMT